MAMTLVEQAKTEQNQLKRGVIELFAKSTPILEILPFQTIEGNSYTYNREHRLPGVAFRGINESFSESVGVINPQTERLKIMGGDADSDLFFKRTQTTQDRRAIDIKMKIKAAGLYFTKIFFDGDESSDPKQIEGMNRRLTGNQVITAGANGANMTQNLLDQLLSACEEGADVLLMGAKMERQTKYLCRQSTLISEGLDAWGELVWKYAGVPIRVIRRDNNDNEILAMDETQGTSVGVCGSIYALKFGAEEYVAGIQSGPIDVRDLGEIDAKSVERTRIEWDIGIAMFHTRCAARLKGITVFTGIG